MRGMRRGLHTSTSRAAVLLLLIALTAAACRGDNAAPAPTSDAAAATIAATSASTASAAPPGSATGSTSTVAAPAATEPDRRQPFDLAVAAEPAPSRCAVDAEPDPGSHTIYVWHRFAGDVVPQWFGEQIARYEQTHPGVRVVFDEAPSEIGEQLAELQNRPPDQRPDIILGGAHAVRMQYDSQLFIAPEECTGGETPAVLADLLPAIRHHYTVDGVLWAAPFNVSAPVMMYDRARWRAAGLDPDDPPTTFDELYAVIDQLVASGQSTSGLALYDESAMWLVEQNAARNGRFLVEPANGHVGREIERVVFDHPGVAELLSRLHELKDAGKLLWLGLNEGDQADLLALVLGAEPGAPDAAITFHTSGSIGDIHEYLELDAFRRVELGVAPIPGFTDAAATGSTVGGSAWWLVDRGDPVDTAAAWDLVEWLSQPERIADLAAFSGYAPTSPAAAAKPATVGAWAARPGLRVAYDELAALPADDAANGWQVGPRLEVQRQLELAVAFAIDAGLDPAEQLAVYAAEAQASLDAYADSDWD